MPSPFPGIDPYLENPEFWSEVQNRLIVAIADSLSPHLRPKYRVAIKKRVYDSEDSLLVGIADVAVLPKASMPPPTTMPEKVRESYLEIREIASGQVVTVIEILSPKNKWAGVGRTAYEKKRQQVLSSATHLVEIDLLRGGTPMLLSGNVPPMSYYILVSKSGQRPLADLYPFGLQEEIPIFTMPLISGEVEPEVDLQLLLNAVYDRASLDLAIDYRQPPSPNLSADDTQWADLLLRQQGLRA
jgi:hypothetical protein